MPTLKAPPSGRTAAKPDAPLRMSEEEFIEWCTEDTWAEWVDGEVIVMNAVSLDHNNMFFFLAKLVGTFVEELKLGRVCGEPFQIRFGRQRRRRAPDLFFVSNEQASKLDEMQFNGAPDLIIEIVSPESQSRDRRDKFNEYQSAGVREYWLIDPLSRSFEAHALGQDSKFHPLPVVDGAVLSSVLHGLFFRPEWVFQPKLPRVLPLVQQMIRARRKRSSTRKA